MAEIIDLFPQKKQKNELGFPHVVCLNCGNNLFYISTHDDGKGNFIFDYLICPKCNNTIPVRLKPVFKPEKKRD